MNRTLTSSRASQYLCDRLLGSGGLAKFLRPSEFSSMLVFAGNGLVDSESIDLSQGKGLAQHESDGEFIIWLKENAGNCTYTSQSVWSKSGDFDEMRAGLTSYFLYSGQYYFSETELRQVDLQRWRRLTVAFEQIIYVFNMPTDFPIELLKRQAAISDGEAERVAQFLHSVFVPAFDCESWMGAILRRNSRDAI